LQAIDCVGTESETNKTAAETQKYNHKPDIANKIRGTYAFYRIQPLFFLAEGQKTERLYSEPPRSPHGATHNGCHASKLHIVRIILIVLRLPMSNV